MNKIDFSYLDYYKHPKDKMRGRQEQAVLLAKRMNGGEMTQATYSNSFVYLLVWEIKHDKNNYRKLHGKPMRRRHGRREILND